MTETLTLLTAIFSAIATLFAVVATWYAPRGAAKLAESLRRDAERQGERHKLKVNVFVTLMQERSQIYSDKGVRALNLIDVVFNESRPVREAWSELFGAFNIRPLQQYVIDERLRKLLSAIADDIGLAEQLRNDDLGRVYVPVIQQQERFIKDMQRQQILANLQGQNAAAADTTTSQNIAWPPKPD
jgi:hypothetical protein